MLANVENPFWEQLNLIIGGAKRTSPFDGDHLTALRRALAQLTCADCVSQCQILRQCLLYGGIQIFKPP